MPENALKDTLGQPQSVNGSGNHEVWVYPDVIVFVLDGKVVGWREPKKL